MTGEVEPQDKDSALVERIWTRELGLTERTLEGKRVTATFLDPDGRLQHAAGKVARNAAGALVIKSRNQGGWWETLVTRDANVDVMGRKPSR